MNSTWEALSVSQTILDTFRYSVGIDILGRAFSVSDDSMSRDFRVFMGPFQLYKTAYLHSDCLTHNRTHTD